MCSERMKKDSGSNMRPGFSVLFVLVSMAALVFSDAWAMDEKHGQTGAEDPPPVFYFPTKMAFWNLGDGVGGMERVYIRQADEHPLKITAVRAEGEGVSAELAKSGGKEHKTYTISVTISHNTPPGPVTGAVIVETDHPRAPLIKIPVMGNVLKGLSVTPGALSIRLDRVKNEGSGVMRLISTNSRKFRIIETSSHFKGLKTETRAINEGKGYLVHVTVSDPDGALKKQSTVMLHMTLDAPQKILIVPVYVTKQ